MVERQKAIWARERGPDDPPGGAWETGAQPRLHLGAYPELVDSDVVLTNCRGVFDRSMAEYVLGLIISFGKASFGGLKRWHIVMIVYTRAMCWCLESYVLSATS